MKMEKLGLLIAILTFKFQVHSQNPGSTLVKFPKPKGPFEIGTTYLNFVDGSRTDSFDDERYRNVFVKFWYPAKKSEIEREAYLEEPQEALSVILDLFQFPRNFFDHLSSLETNARPNAKVSNKRRKYPLIVFQHGYSFWVNQNSILMEHLASHGFVVASISHSFETCYELDDSGDAVAYSFSNPELSKRWEEILNPEVSELVGKIIKTENQNEASKHEQQMIEQTPMLQQSVFEWSADAAFVIDQLEQLHKENHWLSGKLDFDKIGAVGMSFGGAATAQWMVEDERVRAGINMDGGIRGDLLQKPLKQPFMFMVSGNHGFLNNVHFQNAQAASYFVTVQGARHLDFCDLNFISPDILKPAGLIGAIDKYRMNEIINGLSLSFFQKFLVDAQTEMLRYEELEMKERNVKN